jgi:hypothetical protein
MPEVTGGQKTLGKTASFLGILQGVAWFVMSLLCIIQYCIETPPGAPSSPIEYFNSRVYHFYLEKNADLPAGTILKPTAFIVFCCIYILLNTIWVVISFFQLSVINKNSFNLPILFKDWALVTWVIAFVDVIIVVLIGCDYDQNCLPNYDEYTCINTLIPVLVIAARGFILWFVNVIVAWRLYKSARFLRRDGGYEGTFGGILPFYHRPVQQIPRVTVQNTPSLYNQQLEVVNNKRFWNVNLRTAMDNRTPPTSPTSPRTPYDRNQYFFSKH